MKYLHVYMYDCPMYVCMNVLLCMYVCNSMSVYPSICLFTYLSVHIIYLCVYTCIYSLICNSLEYPYPVNISPQFPRFPKVVLKHNPKKGKKNAPLLMKYWLPSPRKAVVPRQYRDMKGFCAMHYPIVRVRAGDLSWQCWT